MMNPILESLYARKSVRAYTDAPISEELRSLLLDCAIQAPSAGCQMLYTILDIRDQAVKDRMAELCDHQTFIARAPMVLVFCADCQRWPDMYAEAGCPSRKPAEGDLLLAEQDAIIAAQNLVVAAQAEGLGSCYIGDVLENQEKMKELLHLPDYVIPACMLVLGWPTQQQKDRPKPVRPERKYLVCTDRYTPLTREQLREMYRERAGAQGFDRWVTAFCKRKYDSQFSKEMSRSAHLWISPFKGKM